MKPIRQKVHYVDQEHSQVMVISGKGNIYPVDLNHYVKEIKEGDTAIVVKSLEGKWLLVDVEPKDPAPLTVYDLPRDNNGDLNIIEHCKYLKIIEGMKPSERVRFDNYLRTKYGCETRTVGPV